MHSEMNESAKARMLEQISLFASTGSTCEYKDFIKFLHKNNQFFLKGHMITNRFLYGSLVKEALNGSN
jgi:hypothetical protein